MSKKLLEESTIRSFMKLANLQPLTDKFLKESDYKQEEGQLEEEALEEEVVEEGDVTEEGKESEGRPGSPKQKVKGVAKPKQGIDGAESVKSPGTMKPLKAGTHHSVGKGNVSVADETGGKSNASDRKPNRGEFEVVSESLEEGYNEAEMEEEMDAPEAPEGADTSSDAAGESPEHASKMKDLINNMLDTLKNMASQYGVQMDISRGDEGDKEASPEGDEEASPEGDAPPEGDEEEQMQEMVERLTSRVAARLVKESKNKR